MKTAVMGAGAVGGYFGALLIRAGFDVTLIARGAHLKAMQEKGLSIKSFKGDIKAKPKTTDNPADVGVVDLILFTVKSYDTEQAIRQAMPMIGENTTIMS